METYFESGQIVNIYRDYQNNNDYLGKAKLLKPISTGLPFMLEEDDEYTYCSEYWVVQYIESGGIENRRIRYVHSKETPSEKSESRSDKGDKDEKEISHSDSFEIMPGWGNCF